MPLSKWSRKHRRTFQDEQPENPIFLEHHRIPPKPSFYYIKKKGQCRMCGELILKNEQVNKRASWHFNCADEYMMIYHPGETRKRIWKRDRGQCAHCSDVMPRKSRKHDLKWHVDHIKPLWEQKGKEFDQIDLSYWEEENLQTLCTDCHSLKSAKEAKQRAILRKQDIDKISLIDEYNKRWIIEKLANTVNKIDKGV
jgi:hypothetical protein